MYELGLDVAEARRTEIRRRAAREQAQKLVEDQLQLRGRASAARAAGRGRPSARVCQLECVTSGRWPFSSRGCFDRRRQPPISGWERRSSNATSDRT